MLEVLQMYAPRKVIKNRCACPIHFGANFNFQIYDTSYYCWVCHSAGDIIKFVANLYGLSYKEAMIKIDYDFNLGLFQTLSVKERHKLKRRELNLKSECSEYMTKKEYSRYAYIKLCEYYRWLRKQKRTPEVTFDLNYLDRQLDKYLDDSILIDWDADALINALKTKHEGGQQDDG